MTDDERRLLDALRKWRCPDCGMGVTKVHMYGDGPRGCGKPPGYWTGDRG